MNVITLMSQYESNVIAALNRLVQHFMNQFNVLIEVIGLEAIEKSIIQDKHNPLRTISLLSIFHSCITPSLRTEIILWLKTAMKTNVTRIVTN